MTLRQPALLTLAILTTFLLLGCDKTPREKAEAFYATRPAPEQPKAGLQAVPKGLPDLRSSTCGGCHPAMYEEWKVSTHAQAWTDRQFQAEITKSGNVWLCINCHTPLLQQMDRWAVGLHDNDVERPIYVENKAFDAALQQEGINCASCHARDGFIEGPTGRSTPAHPTRKAERFLTAEICLDCHQAVQVYPGKTFVCTFRTGEEWQEGPYAGVACQSCHMPAVDRPWARGGPVRSARRHAWPGGGIYKTPGVGPAHDLLPPGLNVTAQTRDGQLVVNATNAAAGHKVPTGDPERFVTIDVVFLGGDGATVASEQHRMGQRWEWWPAPRQLGDNRLAPRESRDFRHAVPAKATGWKVTVMSHRISDEAAEHHKLGAYPRARSTQVLEGRIQPPAPGTPDPAE
jgi:hypothetical protein